MSIESLQPFVCLAIGFAVSGLVTSGYQVFAEEQLSFRLLQAEQRSRALRALPMLMFAAPFLIMRNTIRGVQIEQRRFEFAMLATLIAGFWSLMSGTALTVGLRALGLLTG